MISSSKGWLSSSQSKKNVQHHPLLLHHHDEIFASGQSPVRIHAPHLLHHESHFEQLHLVVNHSKTYVAPDNKHTNTIEGTWCAKFKRRISSVDYSQTKKLQGHLWKQVWLSEHKEITWWDFWKDLKKIGWSEERGLFFINEFAADDEWLWCDHFRNCKCHSDVLLTIFWHHAFWRFCAIDVCD